MTKKAFAGVGLAVVLLIAGVAPAFAQTSLQLINPLGTCNDLTCVAADIVIFLQEIAIPIGVIMVLVGAFQMMTSAGDPEKFSKGRKTILYAAIGIAAVICAGGVASIVKSFFP